MGSSGSVPWYNRPPRLFPAKVWLEGHYPFTISTSVFARPATHAAGCQSLQQRDFPAKVWLAGGTLGWWLAYQS